MKHSPLFRRFLPPQGPWTKAELFLLVAGTLLPAALVYLAWQILYRT